MANRKHGMMAGALLILLVLGFLAWRMRSGYGEVTTNQGDMFKTIFQSVESPKCVPGPGKDASYYTGEGSGGLCGDQQTVHQLGHEYMITSGIGGPLL